jgi:hypothetical protein
MPKIIGESPPSSFDLEFIKNFNEFDFDSLFPNFKVFILSFRKNILYSWRNRVNRYSPIKRSKLKDLSFFSFFNISYSQVERCLKFLGYYGIFTS